MMVLMFIFSNWITKGGSAVQLGCEMANRRCKGRLINVACQIAPDGSCIEISHFRLELIIHVYRATGLHCYGE